MTTETRRAQRFTEKKTEKRNTECGPQMDTDGTQINSSDASGNSSNPYEAPQTIEYRPEAELLYYQRPSFWVSAVFGWFVAAFLLSAFAAFVGLYQLKGYAPIAVGVIIHVIAVFVGLFDARYRALGKYKD